MNHLPACTPYCARVHCPCGADALHGTRTCLGCSSADFFDLVPAAVRGVIAIGNSCPTCLRPEPLLGRPGKGRPFDTFAPDYFCEGHPLRMYVCHQCGEASVDVQIARVGDPWVLDKSDLDQYHCRACIDWQTAELSRH